MTTREGDLGSENWSAMFADPGPGQITGALGPGNGDYARLVADPAPGEIAICTLTEPAVDADTIEISVSELMPLEPTPTIPGPDEIGPTIVGIPIRNELAAARIAHALTNARDAQALIDEAVEMLATVRGLHVETYHLGAAGGTIRETVDLLQRRSRRDTDVGDADDESPTRSVDLKIPPTYEEIAIWMSFGIPVTS